MNEGQMDTQQPVWTKDDLLKLLCAMKGSVQQRDRWFVYTTGQRKLDWEKVAFQPYSSEACQKKWEEFMQKMRKMRTLTELLDEAESAIENPFEGRNRKIHPEFPKKPLTPNCTFFQKQNDVLKRQHPDLSKPEYLTLANSKYKKLSEHNKAEYVERFHCEVEEYKQRIGQLRKLYPKKRKGHQRPTLKNSLLTPRGLWYRHEREKYLKSNPGKRPNSSRQMAEHEARWDKLSDSTKLQWINHALEQQGEQEMTDKQQPSECGKMTRFQSLNETGLREEDSIDRESKHLMAVLNSRERRMLLKAEGLPEKPQRNGYSLFCKEQRTFLKPSCTESYIVICSQRWRQLTQIQRDEYITRWRELKGEYEVKLHQYLSALPDKKHQLMFADGDKILKKLSKKKDSTAAKRLFPGEPKKPAVAAYFVFVSEQMVHLKSEVPNSKDRLGKINSKWKGLSKAETTRCKRIGGENLKKYAVELQTWFLALSEDEQLAYIEENPNKLKSLGGVRREGQTRRTKATHGPSDSGNKEIEDTVGKEIKDTVGKEKESEDDSDEEDSEDDSDEEDSEDDSDEEDSDEDEEEEDMTFGMMDLANLTRNTTDASSTEDDSDGGD